MSEMFYVGLFDIYWDDYDEAVVTQAYPDALFRTREEAEAALPEYYIAKAKELIKEESPIYEVFRRSMQWRLTELFGLESGSGAQDLTAKVRSEGFALSHEMAEALVDCFQVLVVRTVPIRSTLSKGKKAT